jgi:hypothetical protein
VLQHVQAESLLDGLLHGVAVEGPVLNRVGLGGRVTEDLQRLILGGGGKRKIAGVGQHLARFHETVDGIFHRLLVVLIHLC